MSGRPVRVLVAVASRHGATAEIGAAVARAMGECDAGRSTSLVAVAAPVQQRPDPTPFDAVVLGSAVYAGRWLEPAREYAAAYADVLRTRPTWLFSSGPIGEPPFPPAEPHDVPLLKHLLGARGHAVFPGRLEQERLGFAERAMVTAMRAPLGDFRDWAAVRAWGEEVAQEVAAAAQDLPVR
ncbi:flavodoxin domain-containing protein [Blastococcus sp. SYSU DS1024]